MIYAGLWAASSAFLLEAPEAGAAFPFILTGLAGLAASAAVWALAPAAPSSPERPVGRLLAAAAVVLTVHGLVASGWTAGGSVAGTAARIAAYGLAPALLVATVGGRWRGPRGAGRLGPWAILIAAAAALLAAVVFAGPSLARVAALRPSAATLGWAAPACFLWLIVAVALGEAFVFRVGLQGRLEAMLGSSLGAAALLALLFGLGHAWGLHLRPEASYAGPGASLLQAMALGVAGLSPVGLLFGVIWSRTRSLGLVVLLHVALDFLPCLPDFLRAWS
ncbi:hypothetical protein C5708_10430 [Caulobacter sp. CCUG 60055]|uniref:CPBP family glutamic-type intramembrane protease n=1 Tax=Caulobacter sp. CCUG 60055 TaxID=2100090 RepID=UPI001FA7C9D6|nr:CPBP family glutamic-type intramembrane protease [Caulobacter sp. CCUG 60055]MCI3180672.1 hypothetical protein [Caulobacter sp. CCUG 60055]